MGTSKKLVDRPSTKTHPATENVSRGKPRGRADAHILHDAAVQFLIDRAAGQDSTQSEGRVDAGYADIVAAAQGSPSNVGSSGLAASEAGARVRGAASLGTSGPGGSLPYLEQIQRSFGRHDVSRVVAHTDAAATTGARMMGAQAFTFGTDVAFTGLPSLRTAAHEAAHVVQQRTGVQMAGGVGSSSDRHELHADAVADRVAAGLSSESLLDEYDSNVDGERAPARTVQRQEIPNELQSTSNVRALDEAELHQRYDLIAKTLGQFKSSSNETWLLEQEATRIVDELIARAVASGRTFSDAAITRMKAFFIANAKSSAPLSCIATMNAAVRLLVNDATMPVGSEVEKTMAKAQTAGHAGDARVIEFRDSKGRITKGTVEPVTLDESVWDALIEMAGADFGVSVFGMSIMDGYHSVTLTLDRKDPARPKVYWSDQWSSRGGWQEFDKAALDKELESLTRQFWNTFKEEHKDKGYTSNTRLRLWRLKA